MGSAGTDVGSSWYRGLDRPRRQPPGPVSGIAWTVLHALLAFAGGRVLGRGAPPDARALAADLVLDAGWTWAFFRAHRPPLAAVEAALLAASTADLTRRGARLDRAAGRALPPYAARTVFATVLSAEIARRNRR
ncbi:TspO/MBR family protein [Geodermatophilus sp. SYSU D01045]